MLSLYAKVERFCRNLDSKGQTVTHARFPRGLDSSFIYFSQIDPFNIFKQNTVINTIKVQLHSIELKIKV